MREAWAIAYRDYKRGKVWWVRMLYMLLGVAVFIIIAYFVNGIPGLGFNYVPFIAGGTIGLLIASVAFNIIMDLVIDREGFTKLLLVAPMHRITLVTGKILSLIVNAYSYYVVIAIALLIYLKMFSFLSMLLLLIACLLMIICFAGLAFFVAGFFTSTKKLGDAWGMIYTFMLLFSGIIYPLDKFPMLAKILFYINPLAYAVDVSRYFMTGTTYMVPGLSIIVLIAMAIVFPFLGAWMYTRKI
jgi:ABC-2 type transport system permease protein